MKASNNTTSFRLTLRAQASDVPATVRLRSLLKMALRTYQFKCTDLEEILPVPVVSWADAAEQLADDGKGSEEAL